MEEEQQEKKSNKKSVLIASVVGIGVLLVAGPLVPVEDVAEEPSGLRRPVRRKDETVPPLPAEVTVVFGDGAFGPRFVDVEAGATRGGEVPQ